MATAEMAAMLDALMGRNRNATGPVAQLTWESREVCPFFISHFCPHDLFTNTKADLGSCPNIHDDDLRAAYQAAPESHRKQAAVDDFLRICQRMLSDVQSKIKRAKERLALDQIERMAAFGITPQQQEEVEEKVGILTDKINGLVDQAEQAGNQGDVEEAQGLLKLCDQLKSERDELKNQVAGWNMPGPDGFGPPKEREVCEVCGCFQIKGDAQSRVDDHLMGKLHMGYARMKVAVDNILEERAKEREVKEKLREERRKQEEEERAKRREERDAKEKDGRKRSRSGERKRRSKSREKRRSRSKDRRRSRERDRSRERRDRIRERERSRERKGDRGRDRSRERQRDRERDRDSNGNRNRDRERSRDRDRHVKRERDSKSRDREY